MVLNRYKYSEMIITDHNFPVPLDYENKDGKKISIFAIVFNLQKYTNKDMPDLKNIYLINKEISKNETIKVSVTKISK